MRDTLQVIRFIRASPILAEENLDISSTPNSIRIIGKYHSLISLLEARELLSLVDKLEQVDIQSTCFINGGLLIIFTHDSKSKIQK